MARPRAQQIRSLILLRHKPLQELGLIAVLSYTLEGDNNSTAVHSYIGDGIKNDFTAAELTLMGTMDTFLVARVFSLHR